MFDFSNILFQGIFLQFAVSRKFVKVELFLSYSISDVSLVTIPTDIGKKKKR